MKEGILCLRSYIKPDSTSAGIIVKQGEKALETRELAWVQSENPVPRANREKRRLAYYPHPQGKTSASLSVINHFIRQRILLEFLFLVHGVAVGYDFPKAGDPVVGIILWTRNEVQVFPLVFEDDGKAAILWDILGVFFHTFCFMAWPHIPNIFNGDCGKKAEPAVSRGSVSLISAWWGILKNYSFSFSWNLWRVPFPFPPSPSFGTKENSTQKDQKEQEILKRKPLSPCSLLNKEAEYAVGAILWCPVYETQITAKSSVPSPWSTPDLSIPQLIPPENGESGAVPPCQHHPTGKS